MADLKKFAEELRDSVDARLALIATASSIGGFAIAHWNGLRLASESKLGGPFADLRYDLGFGQASWAVFSFLMFLGIAIGIATRRETARSRRLAAQLFMSAGLFCALNLVVQAVQPVGAH